MVFLAMSSHTNGTLDLRSPACSRRMTPLPAALTERRARVSRGGPEHSDKLSKLDSLPDKHPSTCAADRISNVHVDGCRIQHCQVVDNPKGALKNNEILDPGASDVSKNTIGCDGLVVHDIWHIHQLKVGCGGGECSISTGHHGEDDPCHLQDVADIVTRCHRASCHRETPGSSRDRMDHQLRVMEAQGSANLIQQIGWIESCRNRGHGDEDLSSGRPVDSGRGFHSLRLRWTRLTLHVCKSSSRQFWECLCQSDDAIHGGRRDGASMQRFLFCDHHVHSHHSAGHIAQWFTLGPDP
jgi:hypothetical protein